MAITILKGLPALVGTRNDTWLKVQLTTGVKLVVQVIHHATVLTTLRMSVDNANSVAFNLKRILQAIGDPNQTIDVDLPVFNSTAVSFASRNIKYFSVKLMEMSALDVEVSNTTLQSIALLAGLNPELSFDISLLTYLTGPPLKFLTNKPLRKLTGKTTQEFLYFYSSTDNAIDLKFRLHFTDGTSGVELTHSSEILVEAIFPAGYQQLGIFGHIPDGKTLSYYEVYLNDIDRVTEKHEYEIDERCYPDGREFLFLNSLGGMDTLRVLAVEEINVKRESDLVERFVGIDNILSDGKYYEFNVQTNREHKASTVLLPAEERRWIQEFLSSERVFEINNGRFLPIRITSSSTSITKKATDYLPIEFTYVYRFDDIGYSKQ